MDERQEYEKGNTFWMIRIMEISMRIKELGRDYIVNNGFDLDYANQQQCREAQAKGSRRYANDHRMAILDL